MQTSFNELRVLYQNHNLQNSFITSVLNSNTDSVNVCCLVNSYWVYRSKESVIYGLKRQISDGKLKDTSIWFDPYYVDAYSTANTLPPHKTFYQKNNLNKIFMIPTSGEYKTKMSGTYSTNMYFSDYEMSYYGFSGYQIEYSSLYNRNIPSELKVVLDHLAYGLDAGIITCDINKYNRLVDLIYSTERQKYLSDEIVSLVETMDFEPTQKGIDYETSKRAFLAVDNCVKDFIVITNISTQVYRSRYSQGSKLTYMGDFSNLESYFETLWDFEKIRSKMNECREIIKNTIETNFHSDEEDFVKEALAFESENIEKMKIHFVNHLEKESSVLGSLLENTDMKEVLKPFGNGFIEKPLSEKIEYLVKIFENMYQCVENAEFPEVDIREIKTRIMISIMICKMNVS